MRGNTPTVLRRICDRKLEEIAERKAVTSLVEMRDGDAETPMCLIDVAALIDVRTAGQHGQKIRQMFAKNIDVDPLEEGGQFAVRQYPVIDAFRHARGQAASVFDIE